MLHIALSVLIHATCEVGLIGIRISVGVASFWLARRKSFSRIRLAFNNDAVMMHDKQTRWRR